MTVPTVSSGTVTTVSSGVISSNFTITSGNSLVVLNGGTANSTVVNFGGTEIVSSGGLANYTVVSNGGYEYVSSGGTASGTVVSNGGTEYVDFGGTASGTIVLNGGAEIVSSGGTANNTVVNFGGTETVSSGGTANGTTVLNGGYEYVSAGATAISATVSSGGSQDVFSGGTASSTMVSSGGYQDVTSGGTASGTTVLNGGTEYVDSGGTASGTAVSSGGELILSGGTASTTTLAAGGQILLETVAYSSGETAVISAGTLLVSSGGTQVYSQQLAGNYAGDTVSVTSNTFGTLLTLLCYLRGTRILTATGEVPVEELSIGDLLVTRGQGVQPIKWIGRQSFAGRFVRNNRAKHPVCIHAGALGPRLPARDLFVSPGHSMLLDGTLVLASSLVNGVTITQDYVPEEVHYYHIEFEAHDCVIAEGAWSESYVETNEHRAQFNNMAEFEALYPGHDAPEELELCAPRPERGPELALALRPVVARASAGLAPGALRGYLDTVTGSREISGWAQDQAYPELPVLLEVLMGEQLLGTVLACDYRADLERAGYGQGRCSFSFVSPVKIPPEAINTIRVRRAGDGAELMMTTACQAGVLGVQAGLADLTMASVAAA